MKDVFSSARRAVLRQSVFGLATLAGAAVVTSRRAQAADLPQVKEDDPTAKALKYVHDASKSTERKNAAALCDNCRFFQSKQDESWAPCTLFPGKSVNAKGWCAAWAKKE